VEKGECKERQRLVAVMKHRTQNVENNKQDRQRTYNVTLRHANETTVAVEKHVLHIYVRMFGGCGCTGASVCLLTCSLNYPACNAHAPYCHLRSLWLHHIFRHYLTNGTIFRK
jgi:hypothetical protein